MTTQSFPPWAAEYGYVAPPGQWVQAWQSKQDALAYPPLPSTGGGMTGKLNLLASTALSSGLNLGVGSSVTAPSAGDVWLTPLGLYYQTPSGTVGPIGTSTTYQSVGVAATQNGYLVTCSHTSSTVTIAGAGFAPKNVGNLITIIGAGPASNEMRLTGQIIACSGASATLNVTPTVDLTATYLFCFWGSDQAVSMQAFITNAQNNGQQAIIPPGIYLLGSGLTSLPSNSASTGFDNAFNQPPSLVQFSQGCTLIAMATGCSPVITYGGIAGDYSQIVRNAIFGGGCIDGNFIAQVGVAIPFGNICTRQNQMVKNTLLNGVQWGSLSAPGGTSTAGPFDFNCRHERDVYKIEISNITVAGGGAVTVTTAWNHGIPTGRVIAGSGTNVPQFEGNLYAVTATPNTNTLVLTNINGTGWTAFNPVASAGSYIGMAMPSSDLPIPIASVTLGSPTTIHFTNAHGFTGTPAVFLFNVQGLAGLLDGEVTATVTSTTALTVPINTTGQPAFGGVGWLMNYRADNTVESAVNYVNADDADWIGWVINGVRIGMVGVSGSTPVQSDGKAVRSHTYNFSQQGLLFAVASVAYDNTFIGDQVDVPFIFGWRVTNQRNNFIGCRANYNGDGVLGAVANMASFVRLESGATASIIGGGAKAQSTLPMFSTVSVAGMVTNYAPGYSQIMFGTLNVTTPQPDILLGNLAIPDTSYVFASAAGNIDAGIQFNAAARSLIFTTNNSRALTIDSYGALIPKSYTVAQLPGTETTGAMLYCSNARVSGEGVGLGTGSMVTWNSGASAWQIVGTNVTAVA
jgi:hypothetical protein